MHEHLTSILTEWVFHLNKLMQTVWIWFLYLFGAVKGFVRQVLICPCSVYRQYVEYLPFLTCKCYSRSVETPLIPMEWIWRETIAVQSKTSILSNSAAEKRDRSNDVRVQTLGFNYYTTPAVNLDCGFGDFRSAWTWQRSLIQMDILMESDRKMLIHKFLRLPIVSLREAKIIACNCNYIWLLSKAVYYSI